MYVFDASPLIVLATAGHLEVLESVDRPLVIPERVRAEVVDAGLEAGHPDANRVDVAIADGLFDVHDVDETPLFEDLLALDGLSPADAAVIAHAAAHGDAHEHDTHGGDVHDDVAVLDEACGRAVATAEGVQTRGTAYLVCSRVDEGHLTPAEGRQVVDDLVEAGWYCSTDLYRNVVGTLEDV